MLYYCIAIVDIICVGLYIPFAEIPNCSSKQIFMNIKSLQE